MRSSSAGNIVAAVEAGVTWILQVEGETGGKGFGVEDDGKFD